MIGRSKHLSCKRLEADLAETCGIDPLWFRARGEIIKGKVLWTVTGPFHFSWVSLSCCAWTARAEAYNAYDRYTREQESED